MENADTQGPQPAVGPEDLTPAQVAREFRELLAAGARICPAGEARADPEGLLLPRYAPRYRIDLFGTRFYLTRPRRNPSVRFFVAFVIPAGSSGRVRIFPRIFYKDLSLIWRCASHLVAHDHEFWVGKGAVRRRVEDGFEHFESVESTTDLPFEMQSALEAINHAQTRAVNDERALFLLLRNGGPGRVEPYRDFTAPREAAVADPRNRINGGRPVARFRRRNDPTSLWFARGFEPDLAGGTVETASSSSRLYGGPVRRFRIASTNRRIQYLFLAAPRHVWIIPPQAATTELSSYGVRTVDVEADDDLFVPGYEYHYVEDDVDPPELVSQIPEGYVGGPAPFDETRHDASPWLDRLPIVKEFRRVVLGQRRSRRK